MPNDGGQDQRGRLQIGLMMRSGDHPVPGAGRVVPWTELQEIAYQLADGELRRRMETTLKSEGWEINGSAVRFAIINNSPVSGARLVKGSHVRLR